MKAVRYASALLLAGLCAGLTAPLTAQTAVLRVEGTRDDIPATHLRSSLETSLQPRPSLFLTLGVRELRIDQDPFHGLPGLRETLRTVSGEAAALVGGRAALTVGGALNQAASGGVDGEYRVQGQFAVPLGPAAAPAAVATAVLEAARARELSVATALAQRITYERRAGGLDLRLGERTSGSARVLHDTYSDDNRKLSAYAYGLLRILDGPALSVGYAYAYADSERDHWRATGSTFDAATQSYHYEYFYDPYFTPIEERGHLALVTLEWAPGRLLEVRGSANVPLASRGWLPTVPAQGATPAPVPGGYFETDGLLPVQAEASASVRLHPRLSAGARYEHFSKRYYAYHTAGMHLRYTF
jgi:hypothetical protein